MSIGLFFFKFGGHESFGGGAQIPLFCTSGDVSSGFQSQSGHPSPHLAETYVLPLVRHLPTSWQPACQPCHLFHTPARHWWDSKPGTIMPPLTVGF